MNIDIEEEKIISKNKKRKIIEDNEDIQDNKIIIPKIKLDFKNIPEIQPKRRKFNTLKF